MMTEYIDKEAVLLEINRQIRRQFLCIANVETIIKDAPAADVAPVVHGRWRQTSKGAVYCSNCGTVCGIGAHIDEVTEDLDFCSSCGARMDGEA